MEMEMEMEMRFNDDRTCICQDKNRILGVYLHHFTYLDMNLTLWYTLAQFPAAGRRASAKMEQ